MRSHVSRWRVIAGVATLLAACGSDAPVEQPEILYGEDPVDYPLELFDQAQEGEALIRVLVGETGDVDSVEVAESSGHEGLDDAALVSLRNTRFNPARRGDDRVRAWVTVPVRFSTRPRTDAGPGV